MLKRRVPRVLATGFVLAVAVSGLSACRTSPTVAAYVGDEQVTVAELESAVAERRADPDIDAVAARDPEAFTRNVLDALVREEVYEVAAQRYDVQVSDDEVRARIEQVLEGDDPEAVFAQLATQGIGRADVLENVRQQLVREEIAVQEGQAAGLSEQELRAGYEQVRESMAKVSLGYIAVPDQATADAVLAELTANPAGYRDVAARYPGEYTLAEMQPWTQQEIPPPLAEQVAAAEPDTGFTVVVEQVGGVLVGFVGDPVYPSFEEVRPDLERQAVEQAAAAGGALVEEVRDDLGVKTNPKFVFEEGQYGPSGGSVVELLEEGAEEGAAEDLPAAPGTEGN